MNWLPTIILVLIAIAYFIAMIRFRRSRSAQLDQSTGISPEGSVRVRKAKGAHAARAKHVLPADQVERDVYLPDVVPDFYGDEVDTRPKYVGVVSGRSCLRYGFKDGAVFLGDEAPPEASIEPGDFVVVEAPASMSNMGRRIRRVESVNNGVLSFSPDDSGKLHRDRPASEVAAKITHILA